MSTALSDPLLTTVEAHQIRRTGWTESGSTWNKYDRTNNWTSAGGTDTSNDIYPDIVNSWARTSTTGWKSMNIGSGATNPILGLAWGSVVNLMLKPSAYASVYDQEFYYTKEAASNQPYLEITYLIPTNLSVRKGTAETITSSTTLHNDADLKLTLDANKTYIVDGEIVVTSTQSLADFQFGIGGSGPSALIIGYSASDGLHPGGVLLNTSAVSIPVQVIGNLVSIHLSGTVVTSSVGDLLFKWAQSSSNSNTITVAAGSFLRAQAQ
jgi:hypothetical protein